NAKYIKAKRSSACLCIPGTGGTKENLAGESFINKKIGSSYHFLEKNKMAKHYAKMGIIAVAADNPGSGEQADLANVTGKSSWEHNIIAKKLLESGWSYLGYSTFVKMKIIEWMKNYPKIDRSKLIVSGHSLGTEPLMTLGVLDPEIYAFVFNDYLSRT